MHSVFDNKKWSVPLQLAGEVKTEELYRNGTSEPEAQTQETPGEGKTEPESLPALPNFSEEGRERTETLPDSLPDRPKLRRSKSVTNK